MFKSRLRDERKKLGLTQEELAKKLNTTRQNITNWETGYNIPSVDLLKKLSNYFNCSIDYLLGESNDRNSNDLKQDKDNNFSTEKKDNSLNEFLKDIPYKNIEKFIKKITPIKLIEYHNFEFLEELLFWLVYNETNGGNFFSKCIETSMKIVDICKNNVMIISKDGKEKKLEEIEDIFNDETIASLKEEKYYQVLLDNIKKDDIYSEMAKRDELEIRDKNNNIISDLDVRKKQIKILYETKILNKIKDETKNITITKKDNVADHDDDSTVLNEKLEELFKRTQNY